MAVVNYFVLHGCCQIKDLKQKENKKDYANISNTAIPDIMGLLKWPGQVPS